MIDCRAPTPPRHRSVALVLVMALGSGLVAAPAPAVTAAPAQQPEDFYTVPDPLPPGAPGDLIKVEEVTPGVPDGAVPASPPYFTYRVMYHSRSLTGADIAVTGAVFVPVGPPPPGGAR